MKHYLLTASGRDRPGLVAAVSKVLFREGCNLEDSAMTRLQGEFSILCIFSGTAPLLKLQKGLNGLGRSLGLTVQVKLLKGVETKAPEGKNQPLLITVYGADHTGLVFQVTDVLAKARVNVTNLSTHRTQGKSPGYILYLEGEAPAKCSLPRLEKLVADSLDAPGMTVTVKPVAFQKL